MLLNLCKDPDVTYYVVFDPIIRRNNIIKELKQKEWDERDKHQDANHAKIANLIR